jgi:hypothetical protein
VDDGGGRRPAPAGRRQCHAPRCCADVGQPLPEILLQIAAQQLVAAWWSSLPADVQLRLLRGRREALIRFGTLEHATLDVLTGCHLREGAQGG